MRTFAAWVLGLSVCVPTYGQSPWPQFGGDSAGTRTSQYVGPTSQPILKWFFPTDPPTIGHPSDTLIYSSPTIGNDGNIYATSYNGIIYSLNKNGVEEWRYPTGQFLRSSVSVAGDGSLFQLSNEGLLHLDASGNFISNDASITSNDPSVAIDENGRLFVADEHEMTYREANGTEIWSIDVGGFVEATPVVGINGTSYFGSQTGPGYLNAVDDQGQLLWRFVLSGRNVKSATVGSDGTIYAGGQSSDFFAIRPDGTEKWAFSDSDQIYTAAAVGDNGVVFAAANAIFALDINGNELWRHEETSFGHGSVILDVNGNVYATRNNRVIGLTSSGQLMWEYELDASNYVYSSVTLDAQGVLYFGGADGLYAIHVVPELSSILLALLAAGLLLPVTRRTKC